MGDVKDILGVPREGLAPPTKSKKAEAPKLVKPKGMSRQAVQGALYACWKSGWKGTRRQRAAGLSWATGLCRAQGSAAAAATATAGVCCCLLPFVCLQSPPRVAVLT